MSVPEDGRIPITGHEPEQLRRADVSATPAVNCLQPSGTGPAQARQRAPRPVDNPLALARAA